MDPFLEPQAAWKPVELTRAPTDVRCPNGITESLDRVASQWKGAPGRKAVGVASSVAASAHQAEVAQSKTRAESASGR
jgi:hypothetical protein